MLIANHCILISQIIITSFRIRHHRNFLFNHYACLTLTDDQCFPTINPYFLLHFQNREIAHLISINSYGFDLDDMPLNHMYQKLNKCFVYNKTTPAVL